MCPRVCGHGLAVARNTALPDLVAYGNARRTGRRLRCRRPAEPAPTQRCEAGMPTSDTHPPGRRNQQCGRRVRAAGASRFAGAWSLRRTSKRGRATPGPKALLRSRAPRAYTRARAHVCRSARTCSGTQTRTPTHTHTHMHAPVHAHTHACTAHTHAHTHSCTCACTYSCTHAPSRLLTRVFLVACTHTRVSKHARKIVRTLTPATIRALHMHMLKLTRLKRNSPRLRTIAHKHARVCAGRGEAG
jgi:hypothetical protein